MVLRSVSLKNHISSDYTIIYGYSVFGWHAGKLRELRKAREARAEGISQNGSQIKSCEIGIMRCFTVTHSV